MYKTYWLRFYLSCLFVLVFCSPVNAQQDSVKKSDQEKVLTSLPLPKVRFHKPKLLLQDALKKAEGFIATNKIPIDDFFLYRASFIMFGSEKDEKQPGWHFMWMHQEQAIGNYVEIFVPMDGQIRRLTSL